jgi:DNA polymerase-3 subunit delta
MLSPSLFGERRVIVIRRRRTSSRTSPQSSSAASTAPSTRSTWSWCTRAGQGQGAADRAGSDQAAARRRPEDHQVRRAPGLRPQELRADGRLVEEEAVAALLDAVGNDLRELSSAAGQLLADTPGPITTEAGRPLPPRPGGELGFTVA